MTFQPSCVLSWQSSIDGADDCGRTVETLMADIRRSQRTIQEVEAMPVPRSELALMRAEVAQYIVHRALLEVQASVDARAAVKKAAA